MQQLLSLAEVSEARNFIILPVDAGRVAVEATDCLRPLADRQGTLLELRIGAPGALVRADGSALFVLIKNLIENAIQHSPARSVVQITVDAQAIGVRDEGGGIAPDHFDKLFERFRRGPHRINEGAGLGLAICQEIATAHGWSLAVDNVGRGAHFTVRFDGAVSASPAVAAPAVATRARAP